MEKMESIQQQISLLTRKIDRVYQILNRLDRSGLQGTDSPTVGGHDLLVDGEYLRSPTNGLRQIAQEIDGDRPIGRNDPRYGSDEWLVAQQDVPIDSSGVEIGHHQLVEQELSPQIQIQRLTAQLTVAYNRIAALEEQLLAKRWK